MKLVCLCPILHLIQFYLKSHELSRDALQCQVFCSGCYKENMISPVWRVQSAGLPCVCSSRELVQKFSTNITTILVLVLFVNSPYVTGQVSHNCTTQMTSVLYTIMLHLHVRLHLRFAAATRPTHFTLERSFLGVALFNVPSQLANLLSTLVTFELGPEPGLNLALWSWCG